MATSLVIPTELVNVDIEEVTNNVVRDDVEHIVTGSGIFDTLMETATEHLKAQFEGNRIREEDYAVAYIEIYKATLQTALQAWLQKGVAEAEIASKLADIPLKEKELELRDKQIEAMNSEIALREAEIPLKEKQLDLLEKQIELLAQQLESEAGKAALYRRQIESFDEDYKQKILKIMMDAWSVGFSVAKDSFEASGIPATMQKAAIDDLYNDYVKTDFDAYKYKRDNEMLE